MTKFTKTYQTQAPTERVLMNTNPALWAFIKENWRRGVRSYMAEWRKEKYDAKKRELSAQRRG